MNTNDPGTVCLAQELDTLEAADVDDRIRRPRSIRSASASGRSHRFGSSRGLIPEAWVWRSGAAARYPGRQQRQGRRRCRPGPRCLAGRRTSRQGTAGPRRRGGAAVGPSPPRAGCRPAGRRRRPTRPRRGLRRGGGDTEPGRRVVRGQSALHGCPLCGEHCPTGSRWRVRSTLSWPVERPSVAGDHHKRRSALERPRRTQRARTTSRAEPAKRQACHTSRGSCGSMVRMWSRAQVAQ
jgi:hypothetical protein